MTARAKDSAIKEQRRGASSEGSGQHRKRRSPLLRFIRHSENSLTRLKVTIPALASSESSGAMYRKLRL